jgi:uncharacterized protein YbbK (DUF523 family)
MKKVNKEKILISACLMGQNVKYNGGNNLIDLTELEKQYILVPFCPEVEGGLPTPRVPSEIVSFEPLKLLNKEGRDVTSEFVLGAKKCVELVKKEGIKKAILKSKSPSCGVGKVYDGTFSGRLVRGDGVTVKYLKGEGVEVFKEV